jgi:hypothetical protein
MHLHAPRRRGCLRGCAGCLVHHPLTVGLTFVALILWLNQLVRAGIALAAGQPPDLLAVVLTTLLLILAQLGPRLALHESLLHTRALSKIRVRDRDIGSDGGKDQGIAPDADRMRVRGTDRCRRDAYRIDLIGTHIISINIIVVLKIVPQIAGGGDLKLVGMADREGQPAFTTRLHRPIRLRDISQDIGFADDGQGAQSVVNRKIDHQTIIKDIGRTLIHGSWSFQRVNCSRTS